MNWLFRKNDIMKASKDGLSKIGKMMISSDSLQKFGAPVTDRYRPPGIILKRTKTKGIGEVMKYVENCEPCASVFIKKDSDKKDEPGQYEKKSIQEMTKAYIPSDIAGKAKKSKKDRGETGFAVKALELVKDAEKQLVHEIKASEDLFSADNKKSTKRMRRNYSQAILNKGTVS